MPVSEDFRSGCSNFNYKQRYKNLKRKFRYLIYENECFQEELKKAHRRLLKVNQDKSFLLDRLLQYEKVDDTSSDSDGTISSDSELENFAIKRKRSNTSSFSNAHGFGGLQSQSSASRHSTSEPCPKRKKPASKSTKPSTAAAGIPNIENVVSSVTPAVSGSIPLTKSSVNNSAGATGAGGPMLTPLIKNIKVEPADENEVTVPLGLGQGDGHMTSEEIERHLESKQTLLDLVPERAPPTVPTEMFSSDLSCIDRLFADD